MNVIRNATGYSLFKMIENRANPINPYIHWFKSDRARSLSTGLKKGRTTVGTLGR